MRTVITQTLLASWLYTFNCTEGYEEEAEEEFIRTINRERTEPNEAMLAGLEFEDGVYRMANGLAEVRSEWEEGTRKIADIIRGGQIQVRVQREIIADGKEYLLHGICDAVKAGTIYDVKFTTKPFSGADLAGKYLESPQHPAYLYCVPEAMRFVYLVSDGHELYTEEYTRRNSAYIGDIIARFRRDIAFRGLESVYAEKWRE